MSARLKGRRREVERLVRDLGGWVRSRPDVKALALVGSSAYRRPRVGSDVDLVLLTDDPDAYGAWVGLDGPLAPALLVRQRQWGALAERRFRRASGLHVELGVALPSWVDVEPLDPGRARVISDGLQVVHDPRGLLAGARAAAGTAG